MVMGELPREADLVVLGGGPGGYAAAFRAADLGLDTVLVEARGALGGECLHVGCIPSKALLGIAALIHDAAEAADAGVTFGPPRVDAAKLRAWTQRSIGRLAQGLAALAKARGVDVVAGHGRFETDGSIRVSRDDAPPATLRFKHAIIATGSRPATLPGLEPGPRVWDSTAALELSAAPARLLVVGGGYIGLELGSVYAALGTEVTVVELLDGILPGVDRDLVAPLARRLGKRFKQILLGTKLTGMRDEGGALTVELAGEGAPKHLEVDQLLVAVGRRPLTDDLGLEHTRVARDARGFVVVDAQRRTADPRVFAIGDVAGEPMLAHKAMAEGLVAAEAAAGHPAAFEPLAIPAVVFTDPEVAWCGLMEAEARDARHRGASGEGPVERVGTRRRHGAARRAHQARVRDRHPAGCLEWAWSGRTPATCSPRARSPSRWVRWPGTSPGRFIPTPRSPRRWARRPSSSSDARSTFRHHAPDARPRPAGLSPAAPRATSLLRRRHVAAGS